MNRNNIYELIHGMPEIKINNAHQNRVTKWNNLQEKINTLSIHSALIEMSINGGNTLISRIKELSITGICATLVIHDQMTLGTMMTISYIVGQLSRPVSDIIDSIKSIQDASISYERLDEVINQEQINDVHEYSNYNVDQQSLTINLREVSFKYPGSFSTNVIKNLSTIIPHNKVTAIVGASGSGKTTLIKLMLGFYKPQQGEICVGDQNIVDDYNSTLSDIISSCNLQCEWSLIDSDGNVIIETTQSSSFEYLPENDEAVTITFRLVDSMGNKSDMRSVSFNLKTPFNSNYTYVVVNTYGGVYFIKEDNTYDIGLPTDDLTITFRNAIMNDNDNLLTLISKYLKGNNCYMDCYNANSGYGVSLVGSKVSTSLKWRFNLFDHSSFIDDIESAINYEGTTRQVISEYDLVIKNSAFEALQRMPFRIIYNPYFGIL